MPKSEDWGSPAAQAAFAEADLGLPLDSGTRLRLLKRAVVRVSWLYLRHQIDFNHHILNALSDLVTDLGRRFDTARTDLSRDMADELDRGLRQAYREIGDHVARSQSDVLRLQREIAELKAEVRQLGRDR
jgi:hypothetical protein